MAGEQHIDAACEAVHEIVGDKVRFAVVVWIPGREATDEGIGFGGHPEGVKQMPTALRQAAKLIEAGII